MSVIAVLVALQALQPAAQVQPETIVAPLPPGFTVANKAAGAGETIEERVPEGETVDRWSKMITVQRFSGLARFGPHVFLERLGALIVQACPGAEASPIADSQVEGHATAEIRVDCPLNSGTGKPEAIFARALQGESDVHVVQYAYRAKADTKKAVAAKAYLSAVRLELAPSSGK